MQFSLLQNTSFKIQAQLLENPYNGPTLTHSDFTS